MYYDRYYDRKVPDIAIGQCFLFEGEKDSDQGHVVSRIFSVESDDKEILVAYTPEWTRVPGPNMYYYGKPIKLKNNGIPKRGWIKQQ